MKALLYSWKNSCLSCSPRKMLLLFSSALYRLMHALRATVHSFAALLIIDLALIGIFGSFFIKFFSKQVLTTNTSVPFVLAAALFVLEINWLVLNIIVTLFVRKKEDMHPLTYIRKTLFAVLKAFFFWYLIVLFSLSILISLGIFSLPSIHWSIIAVFSIIKFLVLFFWLNDTTTLKYFFIAIEKAVNCFFYNMPFFILLIGIIWGIDYLLKILFFGDSSVNSLIFLLERTENIIKAYGKTMGITSFICFRYLGFFIKQWWVSLIFIFFDQKKDIVYSQSYFDIFNNTQHLE